jgi:sec-independent protein translocase protein TatA
MPFGIQPIHLIVIAIVALLIFGPSRLPEIGRGVGKAMMEFRHSFREMNDTMMDEANKSDGIRMTSDNIAARREPASVSIRTCPECGAPIPQMSRFCNACGARLAE